MRPMARCALRGVSLKVSPGEVIALIGANGAGKSTTLRVMSGLVTASAGDILLDGGSIARHRPDMIVRSGIAHCPEERRIWPELTVHENLALGAYICRDRSEAKRRMEDVLTRFPRLRERSFQLAGTLSGGEQQMLAIGRGLMAEPRLLILDEPSLGLSPVLVDQMFALIKTINDEGTAVLLVEQNVVQSLAVAHRAYVIENGAFVLQGSAAHVSNDPSLRRTYLGL